MQRGSEPTGLAPQAPKQPAKGEGGAGAGEQLATQAPANVERLERGGRDLSTLSNTELLGRIAGEVKELVTTEVQLAKAEVQADLRAEIAAAKGLGAGALLGYCGVVLLFVTAIFALANVMPGWGAALLVTGVVLLAAAISAAVGWNKRVKSPLDRTRRQVKQTLDWAKGQAP